VAGSRLGLQVLPCPPVIPAADWKEESSVAGGAWTSIGGGKYVKAK
jgi:hypothetical protein